MFVKDFPCRYKRYLDLGTLDDVVPDNYIHVFLIRNPLKAIPSLFKLMQDMKSLPIGRYLGHVLGLGSLTLFWQQLLIVSFSSFVRKSTEN